MGIQSKQVQTLSDYLEDEAHARGRNLSAFDLELELADLLFQAAQTAYSRYPILIDAKPHRAKCSLVLATIRYYATAIDLCLRGNGAEAMSVMRSTIEFMAYASKVKREPHLVDEWVDLDEKTTKERRDLFGRDFELVNEPETAKAAEMYGTFSEFGVHARFLLAEQATDFDHPIGWRIRHAEKDSNHVRWALLGIIFTMKDLVTDAIAPLYLETPWPDELMRLLETYEVKRQEAGKHRQAFTAWVREPKRPRSYQGRVIPARGFWSVE